MEDKTRQERLRGINEMLVLVKNELTDFISADDTTLTPGGARRRSGLMFVEYHLSKYLAQDRKPIDLTRPARRGD